MMRGRGRGRGGATSQAPAVTHQQHQQQQQSSTPTTTSTATASDDPFANITGGGGIGKTSITAAKGASDHTSMGSMNSKRLPSGASGDSANLDKYFAPPLYPVCSGTKLLFLSLSLLLLLLVDSNVFLSSFLFGTHT